MYHSHRERLMKWGGSLKLDEMKYISIVGSLMYLVTRRLYIIFEIPSILRYMSKPTKRLHASKIILLYVKHTNDYEIRFYLAIQTCLVI